MKRAPFSKDFRGGQPAFVFLGPSAWRLAKVLRAVGIWACPVRAYSRMDWSDLGGVLVIAYDSGMQPAQVEQLTDDMINDGIDEVRLCAWPPQSEIPSAGYREKILAEEA